MKYPTPFLRQDVKEKATVQTSGNPQNRTNDDSGNAVVSTSVPQGMIEFIVCSFASELEFNRSYLVYIKP